MGVAQNYLQVKEHIASVAQRCGRNPQEITFVAVSKFHPAALVNEAIAAGCRDIGENRAQELCEKLPLLDEPKPRVHFIGHLQTNKIKLVVGKADLIQSVDSLHLMRAISEQSQKIGIVSDVLLELNLSGDESKTGMDPVLLEQALEAAEVLRGLRVKGLMTIASLFDQGEQARPCFEQAHKIFVDTKCKKYDNSSMEILSMGMSGDFETAIEAGSTMVRIGTAVFGPRV